MTTDNQTVSVKNGKPLPFGNRLQTAREEMGLERKDVAQQLRLNEKIVFMMEKNRYAADIPVIFIRGYLRSYAKFLNIPESELKKAIEHIKAKPIASSSVNHQKPTIITEETSHRLMTGFTSLVVLTLVSLIGTWWFAQNKPETMAIATKKISNIIAMAEAKRAPVAPAAVIAVEPSATTPAPTPDVVAESFQDSPAPTTVVLEPTKTVRVAAKSHVKRPPVIVQDDDRDESDDID